LLPAGNSTKGDLGSLVRLPTELLQRIWALSVKRGDQEPVTDWNKWLYASIGMRRQVTAACRCNNLAAMAASRMWSCPEVHFSEAAAEYVLSLRKCDPRDLLKDDFEEVATQVGFMFPAVTDLDNGVAIQHNWDRNYLDNLDVFGEPQANFLRACCSHLPPPCAAAIDAVAKETFHTYIMRQLFGVHAWKCIRFTHSLFVGSLNQPESDSLTIWA